MQTSLTQTLLHTPGGQEADRILRNCVHCGFCTATCPTYQLLGDERLRQCATRLREQAFTGHQQIRGSPHHRPEQTEEGALAISANDTKTMRHRPVSHH